MSGDVGVCIEGEGREGFFKHRSSRARVGGGARMLVTRAKPVKFVRSRADYLRNTGISWKAARAPPGRVDAAAIGCGQRTLTCETGVSRANAPLQCRGLVPAS